MGFSVSASTAIIFAGLFLAAGTLYPAVSNGYEQVQDAEIDRDKSQLDLRNTAIEIQSTQTDKITVTNNGSTSLTVSEVDLIVDGVYQQRGNGDNGDFTATVVGTNEDTDLWLPGEALEINFNSNGAERAKVVTEHGISVTTGV